MPPSNDLSAPWGGAYLFAATFGYANGLIGGNIFLPYLLFLMYTMITELYDKASNPINNWALTLFGQIYCAGSFSLLNFITSVPNTPGEIVHIPILPWLFSFSYG